MHISGCFINKSLVFFAKLPEIDSLSNSICSCSKDHILEHEFCHLGCWAVSKQAVSEKILKRWNFCYFLGCFFHVFMGKNLIFQFFFYILATSLKSCFIKEYKIFCEILKKIVMNFLQATTHDFLVGNRECNTKRGSIEQLYIALGSHPPCKPT